MFITSQTSRMAKCPVAELPRLPGFDQSLWLWREGYPFIAARAHELGTDLFRGRVLGKPTIFMTGPGAAELFYDGTRFRRAGAVPARVQKTLFGAGGVQALDGHAHRQRKALFMHLMTRESLALFRELSARSWAEAIDDWSGRPQVCLFDEARFVLCRAACTWAGLPVSAERARQLAGWFHDMVDGFASFGQRALRARWARRRAESWACRVIADVRHGRRQPPPMTAVRVFAEAEADGRRLPLRVAAVELLNIVRPITAIAWWVAFLALALRDHARDPGALAHDNALLESFVQEVRRFYPFTPFLGARPSHAFEWRGAAFEPRQLVLLDVYGTLHDPRLWEQPDQFRAQRFIWREPTPFDLIPNGGGDVLGGHRCAGEQMTIEALCQAARVLVREIEYALPPQDLSFSLARIPTRPASGVLLEGVRRRAGRPQRLDLALQRGFDGGSDTAGPVSH